jgi:hypothetical protein
MKSYSFPEREDIRFYRADTTTIPFSLPFSGEVLFCIRRIPDSRPLLLLSSTEQSTQFTAVSVTISPADTAQLAQGYYQYDIRVIADSTQKAIKFGVLALIGHIATYQYDDGGLMAEHHDLNGLSDDDHPQYLNNARGDTRYLRSDLSHNHQADHITAGILGIARLPVALDGESAADKIVRADDSRLSGGGSGVTDHGALSGLSDDDHPQYLNNARGDTRYAGTNHNHVASAITSGTMALARLPVASDGVSSATQLVRADDSRLWPLSRQGTLTNDWANDDLDVQFIGDILAYAGWEGYPLTPLRIEIMIDNRVTEIRYNSYLCIATWFPLRPEAGETFNLISLNASRTELPIGLNNALPAIFAEELIQTSENTFIQVAPEMYVLYPNQFWWANIHSEGNVIVGDHFPVAGQVTAAGTITNGFNATQLPESSAHEWRFPHYELGRVVMARLANVMADDDKRLSGNHGWDGGNFSGNYYIDGNLQILGDITFDGLLYAEQITIQGNLSGACTLIASTINLSGSLNILPYNNSQSPMQGKIALYTRGNMTLAPSSESAITGAIISGDGLVIGGNSANLTTIGCLIGKEVSVSPTSPVYVQYHHDYWPA